jgi:hypothetical protein
MTSPAIVGGRLSAGRLQKPRFLLTAKAKERQVERRLALVWGLLFFNVLTYSRVNAAIPLPGSVGKGLAQAALPVALLIALTINRKLAIRPNVFMLLATLLALECVFTAFGADYPKGTWIRTIRFVLFVVTLWLTTPYWGHDKMLLARNHQKILFLIVCSSIAGWLIAPHKALNSGRFNGTIWPIDATQLAHYAAVCTGITVIFWFGALIRGRIAAIMVSCSFAVLLLTHTRTAILAMIVGLMVAGASMLPASARVRRTFLIAGAVAGAGYVTLASVVTTWLARGQSAQEVSNLTGRTAFWAPLLAYPRNNFEKIFGFGVSNGSFNGLPIDSNWLESYQDQGLFGDTICGLILLFLAVALFIQARGVDRAIGLFLVVYVFIASFTEDGITNASPYLLDVAVAASLLLPDLARRHAYAPFWSGSPPDPPLGPVSVTD